jgi:hypothetical protein
MYTLRIEIRRYRMKAKQAVFITFILFCFLLVGCQQSDKVNGNEIGKPMVAVLSNPDKIIIYNKEKFKELDKDDAKFDKIVELTNKRFHSKLSTSLDIIDEAVAQI